ncbi:MAG: glycosyltransferase [Magnetococcales bacterium]|nr:glycosyltransferase [Magnetococcales bacterium]
MIRLVLVITGLKTGGAEIMLLKLIQHLDRTRFEPTVISLTDEGDVGAKLRETGVAVYSVGMRPNLLSSVSLYRLIALFRQIKPDIVHTWMYHADLVGGVAARLSGVRHIAWCLRNSDLSAGRSKRTTRAVMRICALLSAWLPDRIVSCSKRGSDVHVQVGYRADKMHVIPNGFELERFVPDEKCRVSVRLELNLSPQTPLVGLMARNHPQKNHFGFIEAAALVHRAIPDVHFVLAGTGIDHGHRELMQLIEHHELEAHMHLLGRREDMPRLIAALDVLASSSSFGEAFPNVLGEAMACGVPCVVTDVGDSSTIVGDTGRVVQSGDMVGLAQQLVELLQGPAEYRQSLGRRARDRVQELFDINTIARRYESFYVSMLETT